MGVGSGVGTGLTVCRDGRGRRIFDSLDPQRGFVRKVRRDESDTANVYSDGNTNVLDHPPPPRHRAPSLLPGLFIGKVGE